RAAIVPTKPLPSRMTSFDSSLRWDAGRAARRAIPSTAPPNAQANAIAAVARELMAWGPSIARPPLPAAHRRALPAHGGTAAGQTAERVHFGGSLPDQSCPPA